MSKKNHSPGPVPPGNRPHAGGSASGPDPDEAETAPHSLTNQEEDPKHRMGDFTGKADHARQEPGPKNDGGKRHGEDAG